MFTPPCYNNTTYHMQNKNTKYKHISINESTIYAQWNGLSVTKPNPENCKNCSSKCTYDCAQLQYNDTTQNSSDNLHSYLQTTKVTEGEGGVNGWTSRHTDSSHQDTSRSTQFPCHILRRLKRLPTHLRSTSISRRQFRDGLQTHPFLQTGLVILWDWEHDML